MKKERNKQKTDRQTERKNERKTKLRNNDALYSLYFDEIDRNNVAEMSIIFKIVLNVIHQKHIISLFSVLLFMSSFTLIF